MFLIHGWCFLGYWVSLGGEVRRRRGIRSGLDITWGDGARLETRNKAASKQEANNQDINNNIHELFQRDLETLYRTWVFEMQI